MKQEYSVSQLTSDRVAQAYPLVRDAMGHPSLEQWTEYAGSLVDRKTSPSRAGIVVAERGNYIRGMFSYRILASLSHGQYCRTLPFSRLRVARVSLMH